VLARLSPQQVQRLYAQKLASGLSARSVGQLHTMFKDALHDALQLNLVQRNVLELVDAPRAVRAKMHPLDPGQATALLGALEGDRLYALFVLAIHTGMRQGELLALTWRDVDLDRATVQAHASLQRAGGVKRIKEPKTAAGRRRIALSAIAVAALRRHRVEQLDERMYAGPAWQEQDLVFPNRRGRMACYTTVTVTHCKPALKKAALPGIRFHDLRHTAATLLLLQNVPAKVVSEMLGHASVAITLDLYSHVLPAMQDSAAAALDRLFA
jgi:integrase